MNDWNRLVKKLIEEERALGNDIQLRVILVKAKKIKNNGGMEKYLGKPAKKGKKTAKRNAKKAKKTAKKRVNKK